MNNNINLIPPDDRSRAGWLLALLTGVLVTLIVGLGWLIHQTTEELGQIKNHLQVLEEKQNKYPLNEQYQKVNIYNSRLEQLEELSRSVSKQSQPFWAYLMELTSYREKYEQVDLLFSEVNSGSSEINIMLAAIDLAVAADYLADIEQGEIFSGVNLVQGTKEWSGDRYNLSIQVMLDQLVTENLKQNMEGEHAIYHQKN